MQDITKRNKICKGELATQTAIFLVWCCLESVTGEKIKVTIPLIPNNPQSQRLLADHPQRLAGRMKRKPLKQVFKQTVC